MAQEESLTNGRKRTEYYVGWMCLTGGIEMGGADWQEGEGGIICSTMGERGKSLKKKRKRTE